MNWEAAEVGRDFPFPSGRRGDSNFPLCSQSQAGSSFIGRPDSGAGEPKPGAALRCLLGGRRNSFTPPLQLQRCNYTLWWKTPPPLLISREIKVKNCYVPESQLCFVCLGKHPLLKHLHHPIPAVTEEWELKDFSKSLSSFLHIFFTSPHCWGQGWQVPCQVFPWHAKWHILSP